MQNSETANILMTTETPDPFSSNLCVYRSTIAMVWVGLILIALSRFDCLRSSGCVSMQISLHFRTRGMCRC